MSKIIMPKTYSSKADVSANLKTYTVSELKSLVKEQLMKAKMDVPSLKTFRKQELIDVLVELGYTSEVFTASELLSKLTIRTVSSKKPDTATSAERRKWILERYEETFKGREPQAFVGVTKVDIPISERNLPFLPVELNFFQDGDGYDEEYTTTMNVYALLDTGAQSIFVCKQLLPPSLQHLKVRHEPYMAQVRIAGCKEFIDVAYNIRDITSMPNNAAIIILGQFSFLDSIYFAIGGSRTNNFPNQLSCFQYTLDSSKTERSDFEFTSKEDNMAMFSHPKIQLVSLSKK